MTRNVRLNIFSLYFLLNFLLCAGIVSQTIGLRVAFLDSFLSGLFITLTWLTYSAMYLIPAILITLLAWLAGYFWPRARLITTYGTAILTMGLTTLLLYANYKIFSLYGTYINGFIINLVITPGGIDSLGGSTASSAGFGLIAIGFFTAQAFLLWVATQLVKKIANKPEFINVTPIPFFSLTVIFAVFVTGVHFTYAASEAFNKDVIISGANTVPFFQTVTSRHLFQKLGFNVKRAKQLQVKGNLNYPLAKLDITPPIKPLNIIWLAAESWRADALDAHVMPATWKFAQSANRFTQNYSGGNGTRMGVFSMFTGLPGNYWFPFLEAHRGAALIDVMQQQQYQISIYTSALFSYPEFEKTLFSKLQKSQMQELQNMGTPGWERDRKNVKDMLNFIDNRDKAKPFFTFMFFESPHARYYFPPESVIATPYNDDINYASLDKETLRRDIKGIKNRYINSVHHLDSQFERVFDYLDAHQLRENTIVILLGDHGEEFMEHGYWGHNSTFVDQQVRTPLVVWLPNQLPSVQDKLTSHMDIIPTVMPLLGVQNPTSDYALGFDLFGKETRQFTYISDWSRITYMNEATKITIPVSVQGFAGSNITGGHDEPLSAAAMDKVKGQKAAITLQILEDLQKFTKNKIK